MGRKRAQAPEEEVEEAIEVVAEAVVVEAIEDNSHWTREAIVPLPVDDAGRHIKIMSWNVNGLKALVTTKKDVLLRLVEKHTPDILCFQETKIQDSMIELYTNLLDGYEAYWNCSTVKKGYAGTAVFIRKASFSIPSSLQRSGSIPAVSEQPAKKKQAKLSSFFAQPAAPPTSAEAEPAAKTEVASLAAVDESAKKDTVLKVSYDFEDEEKGHHGEGRTITVECGSFILVACYVPNSGEGLKRLDYRIDEWEPHMRAYLRKLSARKPVIYTGDLNCGHLDLDMHNPGAKHIVKQAGLTPVERAAFSQMLQECGFRDAFRHLYPNAKGQFTYWSQRLFHRGPNKGLRLDYFICSDNMFPDTAAGASTGSAVSRTVTVHDSYILHEDTVGCSDHCPVVLVARL